LSIASVALTGDDEDDAASIRAVEEAYDVPTKQPTRQLVTSAVVAEDREENNDDGGPPPRAAVVNRREAAVNSDDARRLLRLSVVIAAAVVGIGPTNRRGRRLPLRTIAALHDDNDDLATMEIMVVCFLFY
jgi:hypothetical protein